MSSLKGDKAAQRKRRQQDRREKLLDDRTPRMAPNVRVKSVDLKKLEELFEDES